MNIHVDAPININIWVSKYISKYISKYYDNKVNILNIGKWT